MRKLGLCLVILAGSLPAANWFPLANGNSWTYQIVGAPATFTIQVGAPKTLNDRTYFPLTGYATATVLVRYDSDHLLMLDETTGVETLATSFVPGDSWIAPARQCAETGSAQGERVTHDGPAGPIGGALEIRYSDFGCADAGILTEQYAENIGMLRRVNQTIAGPRRWDLVSARVGSTRIQVARGAAFSVSADTSTGDFVHVTMRIDLDPSQSVTLPFTSGQEYEIVVIDASGKAVYRWGIGILFIQSNHTVTVEGSRSWEADVPRPAAGSYTLQAWITTSGDTPRYAASAPLIIQP